MNEKTMTSKQSTIYVILSFIVLILILYVTGIGCPISFLFGVSCPGCGLTRAYMSLIHMDLKSAFIYHPLFILPPIIFAIYISNVNSKIKNFVMAISLILFLVLYLFRIFGGIFITNNELFNKISEPVYINIKEGFIYKCINYLLHKKIIYFKEEKFYVL